MEKITVENLIWSPGKKAEPVLRDVSLTFFEGEIYGILGPNGAGKTTLVRHIIGLKKANQGRILYDDKNLEALDRSEIAKLVSFLPQTYVRDIDFTVEEVVTMGREPYRGYFTALSKEEKLLIDEALEFTGCSDLRERKLVNLSGGELQRVMIARMLVQDTPWLVLDEPVSNLDIKYQMELMILLEKLQKEKKKTIITILHDVNLAYDYCSKIVLMKDGRIFASGDKEEIMTKANLEKLYDVEFRPAHVFK